MADLTGRMIGAMKADVKTLTEIEADPSAMGQAVTVIVIAGIASLVGDLFRAGVTAGVMAFAASPGVFNVLAIIPILGPLIRFLVGVWSLVIAVVAVREVLDYSNTGRAIIVCLIAVVICWIVL